MNIVYASDDNFAEVLGISLISLFETNKSCTQINTYILDDNITDNNHKKIIKIAEFYSRKVNFISVNELKVPPEVLSTRWSKSAFIRIFLRQLIPLKVHKILYLDCDVIVCEDLQSLYATDISNYPAAGVQDCLSPFYLQNLGLSKTGLYYNSGVLLINLDKWNEELFLNFFSQNKKILKYPDQDVINGVCSNEMYCLDIKYNLYTALFDFTYKELIRFRKPSNFYLEREIIEAKKSPIIIHFTTSFLSLRPWIENCQHPYASLWLKYKNMSLWDKEPLRKDARAKIKIMAVKVYHILPRPLSISLVGIIHAWLMPIRKRLEKSIK